jgi:hypothetical protein
MRKSIGLKILSKSIFTIFACSLLFSACSEPTPFLVKTVKDSKTIILEDGTTVRLIGINGYTEKYRQSLNNLKDNYVYLYDENYDPIDEIYEGSIYAYVYDQENNCINNYAGGTDEIGINEPSYDDADIHHSKQTKDDPKLERISGREVESMHGSSLSELYERNKNAVFLIAVFISESEYAQGSGFFICKEGVGVSNYHVFEDGIEGEAYAKTIDNHQYKIGNILEYDSELDYIVFEVLNDHYDFPFIEIADNSPKVGQEVFAIGNPKGLEHTLSKGIVSSFRENNQLIQTTTEITHGSSGGPLFNMNGKVIGITTSGVGEANLNFAMNIQLIGIRKFIEQTK